MQSKGRRRLMCVSGGGGHLRGFGHGGGDHFGGDKASHAFPALSWLVHHVVHRPGKTPISPSSPVSPIKASTQSPISRHIAPSATILKHGSFVVLRSTPFETDWKFPVKAVRGAANRVCAGVRVCRWRLVAQPAGPKLSELVEMVLQDNLSRVLRAVDQRHLGRVLDLQPTHTHRWQGSHTAGGGGGSVICHELGEEVEEEGQDEQEEQHGEKEVAKGKHDTKAKGRGGQREGRPGPKAPR